MMRKTVFVAVVVLSSYEGNTDYVEPVFRVVDMGTAFDGSLLHFYVVATRVDGAAIVYSSRKAGS